MHVRSGTDCLQETIGRNMTGKDILVKTKKEESCEECFYQGHRSHYQQNVVRSMNVKGASGEVSEGNDKYVIGNQMKGNCCYTVVVLG